MCCSAANIYPELRAKLLQQENKKTSPIYYANAFSQPLFPVMTEDAPDEVQFFHWGLIPSYCKTLNSAKAIVRKTVNARSETVFEKKSFAFAARNQRCIVLVTGFFEWHDQNGKKYPFYITIKNSKDFALAGIWNRWKNPETGESIPTFCILTTRANAQMAVIHNIKERMPVILTPEEEKTWLNRNATIPELEALLKPYDGPLETWPVKKISPRSENNNRPETLAPYFYPELAI